MMKRMACVLLWAASLSACLDVAEERARLDERVGRAEIAGLSVRVRDGAAAVLALKRDSLQLWATAPQLEITLQAEAATAFSLRIQNAMPDGVLIDSQDNQVSAQEREIATDIRYDIDLPAGESVLRFAVPDAEVTEPFRFAVFADVQEAIDSVQDIYRRMNATPELRFVVMSGDLTQRGTIPQLQRFQRELRGLQLPCFSTLGNHELGDSDDNYQRFFGRGSRHFVFKGAHFTLLDDASATIAPQVYTWLDGWLSDGREAFHSLYMHLPALDSSGVRNGALASRAEADMLLSKLARSGVDLTIYGHVHTYDAFSNAGIPAFITGGGGAIPERFDHIARHFLVVDVDPTSQQQQTAIVRVD
ncbi:MAG TPA: metallophosphoesterase [Polyangiales bacterium]|nr:metallophosphoesterase [Polyangiales bacterium]